MKRNRTSMRLQDRAKRGFVWVFHGARFADRRRTRALCLRDGPVAARPPRRFSAAPEERTRDFLEELKHLTVALGRCAEQDQRSLATRVDALLIESRDLLMLPCAWLLGGLRHVVGPGADDQDDYTKLAICTTAGGEACGTGGAVAPDGLGPF